MCSIYLSSSLYVYLSTYLISYLSMYLSNSTYSTRISTVYSLVLVPPPHPPTHTWPPHISGINTQSPNTDPHLPLNHKKHSHIYLIDTRSQFIFSQCSPSPSLPSLVAVHMLLVLYTTCCQSRGKMTSSIRNINHRNTCIIFISSGRERRGEEQPSSPAQTLTQAIGTR